MKRAIIFTTPPFSIRSISFHALVHKSCRYICRWSLLRTWKKNIGSKIFFITEHVAHLFTILHYFMFLLPTQHRFNITFFRNNCTIHICITFYFLPLFTCILQKILLDLAFRHAHDVGCPFLRVSMIHLSSLIPTISPRSSSAFN
jgi:hypothetical protein